MFDYAADAEEKEIKKKEKENKTNRIENQWQQQNKQQNGICNIYFKQQIRKNNLCAQKICANISI